jgi:hypothetical membrane protein
MERSNAGIAGLLFLIASTQFFLGLIVAEAKYPGYNLSGSYISDLGVGPSSAIFNTSAFLFGLLSLVATYFLSRTLDSRGMVALLGLMSVGAMGVGVVTSEHTTAHGAVSLMAFWFGGLSAMAWSRISGMPMSAISLALGAMTLAALVLFAGGLVTTGSLTSSEPPPASPFFLGVGPGGMERMIVYPALIWLTLFSGHLITVTQTQWGRRTRPPTVEPPSMSRESGHGPDQDG